MVKGVGVTGVTVGGETGTLSWRKGMLPVGRRGVAGEERSAALGREGRGLAEGTGSEECSGIKKGAVHMCCGAVPAWWRNSSIRRCLLFILYSVMEN